MARRLLPVSLVALATLIGVACQPPKSLPPTPPTPPGDVQTKTFTCTEAPETWTVPAGVTEVAVDAYGAQGGDDPGNDLLGGLGGRATAAIVVTPGETLEINVGCAADEPATFEDSGGFPDGGDGYTGGGGSSDVRRGAFDLSDRLIVGGGGGGVGAGGGNGGEGGDGGGATGTAGTDSTACGPCATGGQPGQPGTGGAGGAAADTGDPGQAGQFGVGGDGGAMLGIPGLGGGGGGGHYGGGGGGQGELGTSAGGGGGGGSGFGPSGTVFETGVREGDGMITIAWVA